MEIKEINIYNRNIINTIMINNWGATEIILRNKIIDGTKSKGFIAEDNNKMVGFLLYDINIQFYRKKRYRDFSFK